MAVRDDTGEFIHTRMRSGSSQRGHMRFVSETLARIRRLAPDAKVTVRQELAHLKGEGPSPHDVTWPPPGSSVGHERAVLLSATGQIPLALDTRPPRSKPRQVSSQTLQHPPLKKSLYSISRGRFPIGAFRHLRA